MDQGFVVIRREEQPTAVRIGEVRQHHVHQLARKFQLVRAESNLLKLENRVCQINVVIEISVQMRTAVFVGRQQTSVLKHLRANEIERTSRRTCKFQASQRPRSDSQPTNRERIPRSQNLLIAPGPYA